MCVGGGDASYVVTLVFCFLLMFFFFAVDTNQILKLTHEESADHNDLLGADESAKKVVSCVCVCVCV